MIELTAAPGPRLMAEREHRGLSTQKAADELHLDAWVIDALEANDYTRIGPPVYIKGHLKRYAELLELPVGEILTGYESHTRTPKPVAAQAASVRLRADAADADNRYVIQVAGSAAAALLILGMLWWKPWHQSGAVPAGEAPLAAAPSTAASYPATGPAEAPSAEVSPATPAASATPATPAAPAMSATSATPATSVTPATPAAGATTSGATTPATLDAATVSGTPVADSGAAAAMPTALTTPEAATAEAAGAGHARIRLSFSADSWVDVHDASGRRMYAGNGQANSVKAIVGTAPMHVYLGFANGVQLEINGRTVAIGPQFVTGHVARFEAGADGVLRRDSRSMPARDDSAPDAQTRNTRPPG